MVKSIFYILFFTSLTTKINSQIPLPTIDTISIDTNLTSSIINNTFKISKDNEIINKVSLKHLLLFNKSSCIAKPGQLFNKTDWIDSTLCKVRLKFFGTSKEGDFIFIVYETGTMGGVESFCNIYKLCGEKIVSQLPIGIDNQINSIHKLRKRIIAKKYYIVRSNFRR